MGIVSQSTSTTHDVYSDGLGNHRGIYTPCCPCSCHGRTYRSNVACVQFRNDRRAVRSGSDTYCCQCSGRHSYRVSHTWLKEFAIITHQFNCERRSRATHSIHSAGHNILLSIGICPSVCICRHSSTSPCKYLQCAQQKKRKNI